MKIINSYQDYLLAVQNKFQPLIDTNFHIDIQLRAEIQDTLFGKKFPANDDRFFRWVWKYKPHYCEETGMEIPRFAAVHMSHILSKGAFPEMRYDPRNINIVLYHIHNIWEFGLEKEKMKLKIYLKNQQIIETLKHEYRQLYIRNHK